VILVEGLGIVAAGMVTVGHAYVHCSSAGLCTLGLCLVDSFFGNFSTDLGDSVLISQSGFSLDGLKGCIDEVAKEHSSTGGITASIELNAHQAIYARIGAVITPCGHPRFSVILSLLCEEIDCSIEDCWRDCDRIRSLGAVVVGCLERRVPPVIESGIAGAYGHVVLATGAKDFNQPLRAMTVLEKCCRSSFPERLQKCFNS
jgi:ribulose-5-phosphate 4-epimerase/fuculose-1-phosphate aldolase